MTGPDRDAVEQLARLAALEVTHDELPQLTDDLTRILAYVSAISEVVGDDVHDPHAGLPATIPPREDMPRTGRTLSLDTLAPQQANGFILVPRLDIPDER